ncbi:MAG: hypothetical protein NZ839_03675, partial [Endomicrobia bacterium]|nr:hypothetical protein [Endomicrobiia bacterium]
MRKNIGISLVSVFFGVVIIGSSLFAQPYTSDTGYVIVRCTVSISVDVLDANATAWFVAVGTQTSTLSTGQTDVSITSIAVRNTSSGAVLKYAVYVSSIQRSSDGINWISDDDDFGSMIKGWYLTQDGVLDSVGEFQLAAVFASSRPASGEFQTTNTGTRGADEFRMNASTFSITNAHRAAYTYKTGGEDFDPAT